MDGLWKIHENPIKMDDLGDILILENHRWWVKHHSWASRLQRLPRVKLFQEVERRALAGGWWLVMAGIFKA